MLHDPKILPRSDLSKEQYMKRDDQTTINHFPEKLLKLKDMMKTKVKVLERERGIALFTLQSTLFLCFHHYPFLFIGCFKILDFGFW